MSPVNEPSEMKSVEQMATTTRSIFERLQGTWLLSRYEISTTGLHISYPFSIGPQGVLMYAPDGYMSVQLMSPGRPLFHSDGMFDGTADEYREAGKGYLAYSGKYEVDEEAETVTHHLFVSLFANWIGSDQKRKVSFSGDSLKLQTLNGATMAWLTWEKASSIYTREIGAPMNLK